MRKMCVVFFALLLWLCRHRSRLHLYIYLFYNFIFKPIPFVRPMISTTATAAALLVFRPNIILCMYGTYKRTRTLGSHT